MSSSTPSSRIRSPGISGMNTSGLKVIDSISSPSSASCVTVRVVSPVRSTISWSRCLRMTISQQPSGCMGWLVGPVKVVKLTL
ncbi:hypothetical protein D3C87_1723280 [compost metagenome]